MTDLFRNLKLIKKRNDYILLSSISRTCLTVYQVVDSKENLIKISEIKIFKDFFYDGSTRFYIVRSLYGLQESLNLPPP